MSSPLAKDKKSFFDKLLIKFHKNASHSNRIGMLSGLFTQEIQNLAIEKETISLLDIGCGDMKITKVLSEQNSQLEATGVDIYPNTQNWENYVSFDGKTLPFEDKSFDIVLFSDVLHHDEEHIDQLLKEAKRVSNFIIIKDHFEYGFFSRTLLQLADIVGNYGYGVSIPKRYFTKKRFQEILKKQQLTEIKQLCPVYLYNHLPLVPYIFKGKYQFVSVIKT
ncbi:class I SAM-dependent methyltransferase [Kordia jejudonensis]|uniref:class I SAM-dependent methyltransferase n=1 Tax=Kordia jejudonensis TaxID=1348245 RepID=UPI00069C86C7|nr:class I SAM-dependent methyltransferase [Kordia jejudonensis]